MNKTSRRSNMLTNTPAELAIKSAMQEVEKLPADITLTDAVVKLNEALDLVGDYVDRTEEKTAIDNIIRNICYEGVYHHSGGVIKKHDDVSILQVYKILEEYKKYLQS
jgi:hypothetical protein